MNSIRVQLKLGCSLNYSQVYSYSFIGNVSQEKCKVNIEVVFKSSIASIVL